MKAILQLIVLLVLVTACSENEGSLTRYIPIETRLQGEQVNFCGSFDYAKICMDSTICGEYDLYNIFVSHDFLLSSNRVPRPFSSNFYFNSDTIIGNIRVDNYFRVAQSTDGGESQEDLFKIEAISFSNMVFRNSNEAVFMTIVEYPANSNKFVHRTYKFEDGSLEVISTQSIATRLSLYSLNYSFTCGLGLIPGYDYNTVDQRFYITRDGGKTWTDCGPTNLDYPVTVTKVAILDTTSFFSLVMDDDDYYLYHSSDLVNWVKQSVAYQGSISSLQFLDKNTGYYSCTIDSDYYGKISNLYKTTDGGVTWEKINSEPIYGEFFYFTTEELGIAFSGNRMQVTKNGGVDWTLISA